MSKHNRKSGRERVRHNRPARESGLPDRPQQREEDRVLGRLSYRKGHLTPQEVACFEELRGALNPSELDELTTVSKTLRRVTKRLRAVDLIRYWGAPLSEHQRQALPLIAGLPWLRELPAEEPLDVGALAESLLCTDDTPRFLLDPFIHPERYASRRIRWDMARIVGVVGRGEGLDRLREYDSFWSWVPQHVFHAFLHTPNGVAVPQALVATFVKDWGGPPWVAQVVYQAALEGSYRVSSHLPAMLRVAHSLCVEPVSQGDAVATAAERLAELPAFSRLFGPVPPSGIEAMPADGPVGWAARELLTPEAFERANETSRQHLLPYFKHAVNRQIAMWHLIGPKRTLLVHVDLKRRRAWHFDAVYGEHDLQADAVIAQWAHANGLQAYGD